MTILVTGATGNIGAELVRLLGAEARPLKHGEGGADLNQPATLRSALRQVDGLFLMPGYADMAGILHEATKAGVRHVVLLSGSSADGGDMDNAISNYMIRSEQAVRDSGLGWTILRPSAFMSNALLWLPQLHAGDTVRAEFPQVAAAVIDPYDIASVAAIALTSAGHDGATHRLTGPVPLLPEERVRILGAALGRDLEFVGLTNEETRAELGKTTPPEYVDAFWRFYVDGTLDESLVTATVAEVTGRPPRTFEQWAEAHRNDFRA